jgi:hypothetical protein
LVADVACSVVTLALRKAENSGANGLAIERTWLQTWLAEHERQERAVFQLRGSQRPTRISLPAGAGVEDALIFWDGEPLAFTRENNQSARLRYAAANSGGKHVLEVRYRFSEAPGLWRISGELPQLDSRAWNQQVYWQLIVPPRWHLFFGPDTYQSESTWTWQNQSWGRVPALQQAELEDWSGALPLQPLPAAANTYLYSGVGSLANTSAWLLPRGLLIWIGAALGFGLGIVLWKVRFVRHPLSLILLCSILLAAAWTWPDPVLLLGQAALLAIPLLAIAALVRRLVAKPRQALPVNTSSPRRGSERTTTQALVAAANLSHHSGSTATVTLPANLEHS